MHRRSPHAIVALLLAGGTLASFRVNNTSAFNPGLIVTQTIELAEAPTAPSLIEGFPAYVFATAWPLPAAPLESQ